VNRLYYGDNLDVLRRYVADETVDLVYLDPPFKSNQDYNVLFAEQDGSRSAAQIKAFEDTWRWDEAAAAAYETVVEGGGRVSQVMQAFRTFLAESDMLAYLAMMAPRLVELRRVLKPTGSIYLHCDPTASHYLKMLMDAIFDPRNFVNEIIWKRSSAHSDSKQGSKHYGRTHDALLFYSRGAKDDQTWNQLYTDLDPDYVESHYRHADRDGRLYMWDNITGPGGAAKGNPFYDVLGVKGHWRYSRERMADLIKRKLVAIPPKGKTPRLKRYLDEQEGRSLGDVWTDIPPINSQARERLGYPTQKPEALLERIIATSSEADATILDPFCGCGTAVAVAQRLGRKWIGIDITHLAITLIRHRLFSAYGGKAEYEVIGEPVSLPDAEALASEDKYQFQWWTLGLVGARPAEQKKGADKGIDGRLYFHDEPGGKTKQIVLSVKGGDLKAQDVRDLRGVIEREKAEIGVLLTLQEPTKAMRTEAASAGFYKQPVVDQGGQQYPRMQIITVGELLAGQRIKYPAVGYLNVTFKKAPRAKAAGEQLSMVAEPPAPYDPSN
jgi:DNA modification methylase